MSEYQYYEFMAIDRPLTREQMAELRTISTRAQITTTRFTNFYDFGSFKGDEVEFLERFFDAHVYTANWGTHTLMFGMPATALDADGLRPYLGDDGFFVQRRGDRLILTLQYAPEDGGGDWVEEDGDDGWMAALVPLRADLVGGDLRAAYLGWLRSIQTEGLYDEDEEIDEVEEDERYGAVRTEAADADAEYPDNLEPPVPAGLGSLSAPLESLARFLEIDPDLVAVAAEGSAPLSERKPSTAAMRTWLSGIPHAERNVLLLRVLQGDTRVQAELLRRFRAEAAPAAAPSPPRRTVRQLLEAAADRRGRRERREASAAEEERKRQAEAAARTERAYLTSLIGKQEDLWQQVESHINTKQQKEYDRAVHVLSDLRRVAELQGGLAGFGDRVRALRERHASKPSLMKRLDVAKLG